MKDPSLPTGSVVPLRPQIQTHSQLGRLFYGLTIHFKDSNHLERRRRLYRQSCQLHLRPVVLVTPEHTTWPTEETEFVSDCTLLVADTGLDPDDTSLKVAKVFFHSELTGTRMYTVTVRDNYTAKVPEANVTRQCLSAYYSQRRNQTSRRR